MFANNVLFFIISVSVTNDTLTSLDLSWNHIRANGAIGICKGVRVSLLILELMIILDVIRKKGACGMWKHNRQNDVVLTSMRRHYITLTSI